MAIILKMTNTVLSSSASSTNMSKSLDNSSLKRSRRVPKHVLAAKRKVARTNRRKNASARHSSNGEPTPEAVADHKEARSRYKKAIRKSLVMAGSERDRKLFEILGENPGKAYSFLKSARKNSPTKIASLTVGNKVYHGSAVCDGFYDSMSSIKTCNIEELKADREISEHFSNHDHILKLCQNKRTIPPIDLAASTKLLCKMKKKVSDIYSITALHYLNAGREGHAHFNFLLNAIISNVNNATLEELNLVFGLILSKGHNKPKNSDRSYRTISTCPFMAKAADLYLRDLFHHQWEERQAVTQYQGEGSNHEMAALLVTEVIQYSLNVAKKPVFLIALDAQSAFDRCLRQILSTQLYKANITGSALSFIDNRLACRATMYHWDGTTMGPSKDDTGFEQGGINSSEYYKLYNNEQLDNAQASKLGIDLKTAVISAIGQADDVVHVANTIDDLHLLVTITEAYCRKYRVKLVPSKTKLMVFASAAKDQQYQVELAKILNPIKVDNTPVEFNTEAEHVGIIRSTSGNLPNLLNRIICHKKSLGPLLSAGMARNHRGNTAASLHVHRLYASPVLFTGLAALVLNKTEIGILDKHFQTVLQRLQRLHAKTPRAVTLFMAGSLPGEAILHIRQLTLFGMICRLPSDPLNAHARYVLSCLPRSAKSWFQQVRDLCLLYALPHPLTLLQHPPPRQSLKRLIKARVQDYWESLLKHETLELSSLTIFNAMKLNLKQPSLLWLMAGNNSFECAKSLVVGKMISGRHRSDYLCRHWTPSNRDGFCLADTCNEVAGDLAHMLFVCPALENLRTRLFNFWLLKSECYPDLYEVMQQIICSPILTKMSFVLDPCLIPAVLALCSVHGMEVLTHVYYLARTYAYYMNRGKLISLGRWPGDHGHKSRAKHSKTQKITKTISDNNMNNISSISGPATALAAFTSPTAAVSSTTIPVLSYRVPCIQHQDKHPAVSATPGVTPPQQLGRAFVPDLHGNNQLHRLSYEDVECEVSSASLSGGDVFGLADRGGEAVTAGFVRACTPPAGQPWRGGTGKV